MKRTSSNTSPKTRSAFGLSPGCSVAVPGCPLPAPLLNMLANERKRFLDASGLFVLSEDLLVDS